MPKFTVGDGFFADFFTVPLATANGEFVVADDHLIRIRTEAGDGRPAGFENYIGNFTYTDEGLPLGRIDEYRFVTQAEAPVYDIAERQHQCPRTPQDRRTGRPAGLPQADLPRR